MIKINHGELPGKPVTNEHFEEWWQDYQKRHDIKLIDESDWTKIDLSKPPAAKITGYEFFYRKINETHGETVE